MNFLLKKVICALLRWLRWQGLESDGKLRDQGAMGSLPFPLLNEMEMEELVRLENVKIELLRQDFTRKYHEQVAELEIAFRQRLYQLHLQAISQNEVKPGKKMQQESSRPVDLGLPEQTGSCSLCKADDNTENDLQKHILGKKHQCMFENWKQGSGDGREGNLMQKKTQDKQSQQEIDIADNLHKRKKQMKEERMLSQKLRKDSSRSVDSKLPEGLGWCSVCEVDCNTQKVLKRHILGKKHQSKIKMFKQGSGSRSIGSKLPERPGWCSLCEVDCNTRRVLKRHNLGKKHQSAIKMLEQGSEDGKEANSKQQKSHAEQKQQEKDVINNLDKGEKQMKEGGICSTKMQQDDSTSLDSGLPEQSGWCSLCEVNCNTEKGLEQHILAKKHQSMLKKLGQGLAGGREENSKQQKSLIEQKQHERDIIDNLRKQEKQITKEDISHKDLQNDSSRSLDSGFPKNPGWCTLCEVECTSEKNLKKHILGKKHQSKFKLLKEDLGQGDSKLPLTEMQQQKSDIINTLDKQEKQITKEGIPGKSLQQDCSRSLDLGFSEAVCCALCEVECNSKRSLEEHILGKKHQSKFKMLKQDPGKANTKQPKYLTEQQQQESDIICNLDKRVKKIKDDVIPSKDLQQDCSRSLDSGFPEQPGWCALCEVECTNQKDLKHHILGKKHQSKLKMLKQDSVKGNSKQQKSLIEWQQHESDIIDNLDEQERQLTKEGTPNKTLQQDCLSSLDSGFPEQPGYCALCEVECTSEKDREENILDMKHQSKFKMLKQDLGKGNSNQQKYLTEKKRQESDIIGNLDKRVNQIKEMGIPSKNLQQDCSRSLDSGLPERPGRCVLCEVQCTSEDDLKKHILGKKHQSNSKMLKQDSRTENSKHESNSKMLQQDSRKKNSKQQKSLTELQQQETDIIDNLDKQEKQITKEHIPSKNLQQDCSTSFHSGCPEQSRWCALCEIECNSEKDLEKHILGKKHQAKLKISKQDPEKENLKQRKSLTEQQQEGSEIIGNLDKKEKVNEENILSKKVQKDCSTSLGSGFHTQSGWCALCEVQSNSEKDIEKHFLGKKHQSKIKMLKQDLGQLNSDPLKPHVEQEQQRAHN
ncbi:hypothetical protein SUGI_0086840 [Cryptomeria japonica]|uniref:uncharacterized protein LOC131050455 isoform X2 n=1 Tax=Cryptomeria japonica TaxID=3369 RepID=UPI002408C459|nr:uncharacterized protein LOC131050455 isoform X2 [Cryptomeria japonica]GLJ08345.1 hypothetical protein SUGI_0086840 [Cryptomeria japonica]